MAVSSLRGVWTFGKTKAEDHFVLENFQMFENKIGLNKWKVITIKVTVGDL